MSIQQLNPNQLYRKCDLKEFSFKTTDDLEALESAYLGQQRALASTEFGIKMKRDGYNLYALGPEEMNKRTFLEGLIREEAGSQEVPSDWVYVCPVNCRYGSEI